MRAASGITSRRARSHPGVVAKCRTGKRCLIPNRAGAGEKLQISKFECRHISAGGAESPAAEFRASRTATKCNRMQRWQMMLFGECTRFPQETAMPGFHPEAIRPQFLIPILTRWPDRLFGPHSDQVLRSTLGCRAGGGTCPAGDLAKGAAR